MNRCCLMCTWTSRSRNRASLSHHGPSRFLVHNLRAYTMTNLKNLGCTILLLISGAKYLWQGQNKWFCGCYLTHWLYVGRSYWRECVFRQAVWTPSSPVQVLAYICSTGPWVQLPVCAGLMWEQWWPVTAWGPSPYCYGHGWTAQQMRALLFSLSD